MATGIPAAKRKNSSRETDYTITYEGKRSQEEVFELRRSPALPLFSICNKKNEEWHNRFYYGDNLHVLLGLLEDKSIRGKVRLIYIDPPYSTDARFESRSQNHAYEDTLKGAHFIEFLRIRLMLLYELLADDGSIYLHLDGNMAFQMKIIMDEIFMPDNFRSWITRKKCNRKNYTRKTYGNVSDYIMFYTKSDNYVWHRPYELWEEEAVLREYPCIDETSGRRYKKVPVHAPGVRNGATGGNWHGMTPPPGKHWQYTPDKLDEFDSKGEIYWSPNGNPRRKVFFQNSEGLPVQDIWLEFKDAHNQNIHITGYPTEKNFLMLDRIIEASSDEGDIVLDCFSGSGTTLARAETLGRKWIGCDSSYEAISTTLKRLSEGTKPMGDYVGKRSKGTSTQEQPMLFSESCVEHPEILKSNMTFYAIEEKLTFTELTEMRKLEGLFAASSLL